MKSFMLTAAATIALLPVSAVADEVTDTLESVIAAYTDGDIGYALEELAFARDLLMAMQTDTFESFLPEAPDGWTREIDNETAAGMALFGGGTGVGAHYTSGDGQEGYKITMMADSPMVMSMGAMVQNASAMGMDMERVGRQRVAVGDDQAVALVNNRILVMVEGNGRDLLKTAVQTIDFDALSDF